MSEARSPLKIQAVATFSSPGARPFQEDHVASHRERGIFCVADGFGGDPSGPEAAKAACEAIQSFLFKEAGDLEATLPFVLRSYFSLAGNVLFNALIHANRQLISRNKGKGVHRRGGASVLAGYLDGELLALANVGVCTAWLIRSGEASELVTPRSYGRLLDPFRPAAGAGAQIPLMALGMVDDLEPEIFEYRLLPGDWLVFQTDGLGAAAPQAMRDIQQKKLNAAQSVREATDWLNRQSCEDNAALSLVIF